MTCWSNDDDLHGKRTGVTDPAVALPSSRLTSYHDNNLLSRTDPLGHLLSSTNPLGVTTSYSYDAVDRLVTVVDALGGRSQTASTAAGRVKSSTDPKGQTTTFAYDGARRRISVVDALKGSLGSTYDSPTTRLVVCSSRRTPTATPPIMCTTRSAA